MCLPPHPSALFLLPLSVFSVTSVVKFRRPCDRGQRMSPRINTYESRAKQAALTTFRMNTYRKPRGGGITINQGSPEG